MAIGLILVASCRNQTGKESIKRIWTEEDRVLLAEMLDSSFMMILTELESINDENWQLKPDPGKWSINEIVEHLIVHEELFYRELLVLTSLPEFDELPDNMFAKDEDILRYSEVTDDNKGISPWYLQPKGRWANKDDAVKHYHEFRHKMISFVVNTDKNLRSYYTKSGRGPSEFRDLHQLLLVSVAHTKRHRQQIVRTKEEIRIDG